MIILVRCAAVMAAAIALIQNPSARADDYPSRQVTMIVPWAPAGAVDTTARIIAPKLAERLGKPVIIENRGGAGSTLGTAIAVKAAPDGYTLGMPGSGSMAVGYAMYKQLPYDPDQGFRADGAGRPRAVRADRQQGSAIKTVPDLIAYAKANKIFYASGGPGSPHHIYAEMFKGMTGIEMTHVPYKGSADAIKDVVAGHVQVMFSDLVPSLPLVASGTVRALGVTLLTRWPTAPDIPPLNEAGVPGFDAVRVVYDFGPGRNAEADRRAAACRSQGDHVDGRCAAGVQPGRCRPGGQPAARRAAEVHRDRTGALGQGREAGRAGRDAVAR